MAACKLLFNDHPDEKLLPQEILTEDDPCERPPKHPSICPKMMTAPLCNESVEDIWLNFFGWDWVSCACMREGWVGDCLQLCLCGCFKLSHMLIQTKLRCGWRQKEFSEEGLQEGPYVIELFSDSGGGAGDWHSGHFWPQVQALCGSFRLQTCSRSTSGRWRDCWRMYDNSAENSSCRWSSSTTSFHQSSRSVSYLISHVKSNVKGISWCMSLFVWRGLVKNKVKWTRKAVIRMVGFWSVYEAYKTVWPTQGWKKETDCSKFSIYHSCYICGTSPQKDCSWLKVMLSFPLFLLSLLSPPLSLFSPRPLLSCAPRTGCLTCIQEGLEENLAGLVLENEYTLISFD